MKALLILALTAFSFSASAQGNKSLTGGGTGLEPIRVQGVNSTEMAKSTISINAIQKADGSVDGKINYDWRGGEFKIKAEVKCVTFTGNVAKVTGVITSVDGSPEAIAFWTKHGYAVGNHTVISVQDNGKDDDKFSDIYSVRDCNGRTNTPYVKVSGNFTIK